MQATHIVFDREYKDNLPEYSLNERYRALLANLADIEAESIRTHIEDAYLEFYCKCGCHSFLVYPNNKKELPQLQDKAGAYRELAFKTNYDDELNVMLFTDAAGNLSQVTVFFGHGNVAEMPPDLEIGELEGSWTSSIYDDFIRRKNN